jgi:hypothetical protein
MRQCEIASLKSQEKSMVRMKKVASRVRKAFEEIARKNNRSSDLCGYCCRASVQLLLAAQRNGIQGVGLVAAAGHVYNVYKDHIVDITATQFGKGSPVYVVPFKEAGGDWKALCGPYGSVEEFAKNSGWTVRPNEDIDVVLRYDEYEDPFTEYPYV